MACIASLVTKETGEILRTIPAPIIGALHCIISMATQLDYPLRIHMAKYKYAGCVYGKAVLRKRGNVSIKSNNISAMSKLERLNVLFSGPGLINTDNSTLIYSPDKVH